MGILPVPEAGRSTPHGAAEQMAKPTAEFTD